MNKLLKILLFFISFLFISSCNRNVEDTSKLWEKSQSSGDIISRSGTVLSDGSPKDRKLALQDAENRLRTGGGLFGKKAGIEFFGKDKKNNQSYASVGIPINPYLWKGSLETIEFMPLASADPFGGIIITDWYTGLTKPNERCKLNIFIKGVEMKTNNLKVNSFCQKLSADGMWVDQPVSEDTNADLENAILNKAKKIRLAQS